VCEPVPLLESGHSVIERVILATYPALVVRSSGPPNNEMQRTAPGRDGAPPLISVFDRREETNGLRLADDLVEALDHPQHLEMRGFGDASSNALGCQCANLADLDPRALG